MLILLDIDGVMVPANSWKKPEFMEDGFPMFNLNSVKALQRIISETNASVVLTTSHKTKYKVSQWKDLLKSRGINPKRVQRLSTNSLYVSRKDEILEWYLKKHVPNEEFVIIDDDKMLNGLPENLKGNLILTSPSVGLTDDLADEAISILQNRSFQSAR
ncbi:HAD domain-containing protein [Mucilaginibacter sp. RCC_168]|jgi:type II secretory pathway component PulK|uniref:HAD domain-containing protein n=1 Tax=Mucilaginibacter sp. RCC_168 TaxID=3239221 RepID=UPI0035255BAD